MVNHGSLQPVMTVNNSSLQPAIMVYWWFLHRRFNRESSKISKGKQGGLRYMESSWISHHLFRAIRDFPGPPDPSPSGDAESRLCNSIPTWRNATTRQIAGADRLLCVVSRSRDVMSQCWLCWRWLWPILDAKWKHSGNFRNQSVMTSNNRPPFGDHHQSSPFSLVIVIEWLVVAHKGEWWLMRFCGWFQKHEGQQQPTTTKQLAWNPMICSLTASIIQKLQWLQWIACPLRFVSSLQWDLWCC